MTLAVYGIKNCNTMKKSFDFFNQADIAYVFMDYKKIDIDADVFADWVACFGIEKVINKQGTTYKRLDDASRQSIVAFDGSAEAMREVLAIVRSNPSMIKRPIVTGEFHGRKIHLIGFDEAAYATALGLGSKDA